MNESPAVMRGIEMLAIPLKDLPASAAKFMRFMCKRYMMCLEVMLTAYVVYAQIIERLRCDDDLYSVTATIRAEWAEAQAS